MRRVAFRSMFVPVGFVVLCLGLAGCGSSQTEVNGQVKYNGKPLDKTGGSILFIGPDGRKATALIDGNGNYHAEGVSIGENKVAVVYVHPPTPGSSGRCAPRSRGKCPKPRRHPKRPT